MHFGEEKEPEKNKHWVNYHAGGENSKLEFISQYGLQK